MRIPMTETSVITASAAVANEWDVVVIGAGMGGAAAAYGLASRGLKVLIVERGHQTFEESAAVEQHIKDPDKRLGIGRWPTQLSGNVDGRAFDFFAPLGSGAGGSTLLYASALDRFRPSDFAPRPHPEGGVLDWPYSYDDLAPFYSKAEAMLDVSGTPDPLEEDGGAALPAPPALSPRDADLFQRFEKAGLTPYQLHHGYRFVPDCGPCLGRLCLKGCKRHAGNSFLDPGLASGNLAILSNAEVTRLEASGARVEAVHLQTDGETHRLSAPVFVLAAGTYFSPVLLLKSASEAWPQGLGNHNDQVGRHLMFHTGRSLAVWSSRKHPHQGPGKTIVFRDFYDTEAGKFGEVQSTGAEAAYGNIVYALRQMLATSRFSNVPLLWHLARIPAFAASRLLGNAAIFEVMMEDLPYAGNRVMLDADAPSGMRFHYTVSAELQSRFDRYSKLVGQRMKGIRHIWLSHGLSLNYGHPMGTCRLGTDPGKSVADADGRVHGLDNLYITDGAALPSAGGTNPSLTIAALGLKLGETMVPPPPSA